MRPPYSINHNLVRANIRGGFKSRRSSRRHVVILIHAISADAEPAYQHAIYIQGLRARKKYHATLIGLGPRHARYLEPLRAGSLGVLRVQIKKRTRRRPIDSRRKEWLRAKTDRAICDCRAQRHLVQIRGLAIHPTEVNHVARFGRGYVD